jgi:RNA polymerase sigma-70 factor (sigma-E family)
VGPAVAQHTVTSPEVPVSHTLNELVAMHHLRLIRLGYMLCGDVSNAEDLVADAYALAWPKIRNGEVSDPAAYLRRCVVNGAASWKRRRQVARRHDVVNSKAVAIGEPMGRIDDLGFLDTSLRSLPLAQRQVVVLRYLEDLSEAETARVLGIPIGTVKSRAARALIALRLALGEET